MKLDETSDGSGDEIRQPLHGLMLLWAGWGLNGGHGWRGLADRKRARCQRLRVNQSLLDLHGVSSGWIGWRRVCRTGCEIHRAPRKSRLGERFCPRQSKWYGLLIHRRRGVPHRSRLRDSSPLAAPDASTLQTATAPQPRLPGMGSASPSGRAPPLEVRGPLRHTAFVAVSVSGHKNPRFFDGALDHALRYLATHERREFLRLATQSHADDCNQEPAVTLSVRVLVSLAIRAGERQAHTATAAGDPFRYRALPA